MSITEMLSERAEIFGSLEEANKAGDATKFGELKKRIDVLDNKITLHDLRMRDVPEETFPIRSFQSKDQIGKDFIKGIREARTDVTSTSGAGAIPSFTSTDVWLSELQKIPFIRQSGMTVISPPNNTKYPFATLPDVYFQTNEGDSITPSGTVITSKDIDYKTWGCLVKVSNQALRDGAELLTGLVQKVILQAVGNTISRVVLSGNASEEPRGLDSVAGILEIDLSGGQIQDWSSFVNAMSLVHAEGVEVGNMSWIGGSNIMKQVQNLQDAEDRYLNAPPLVAGLPVVYSNAVLENYSSNKTRYYLGDMSSVVVATSGPFLLNLTQRFGSELMSAVLIWGGISVLVQRPENIVIVKNIAVA